MAGLLPFLLTPKDYELYEMSGKDIEEEEPEEETLSMKLNKADKLKTATHYQKHGRTAREEVETVVESNTNSILEMC